MNNRAVRSSQRGQLVRLAELRIIQFIVDAVRAGERTVLVTGEGPAAARVPEAALTACSSPTVRTLHIRPPLPEPPDLQEAIGAAFGVEGCRDLAPLALWTRLRFAETGRTLVLAIDEAHTLSHQTLGWLAATTDALEPEAPILVIVLAAEPSLLERLARPEFEGLRQRLSRPDVEVDRAALDEAKEPPAALRAAAQNGLAARPLPSPRPIPIPAVGRPAPSRLWRASSLAYAGTTVAALCCFAAAGYVAFFDVPSLQSWPLVSLDALAPQKMLGRLASSGPATRGDPRPTGETVDPLIDDLADAIAKGPPELVATLLDGMANLERGASPDARKLAVALPARLAARARAAAASGRIDEAQRLDRFNRLMAAAGPDFLAAADESAIRSFAAAALGIPPAEPFPQRETEADAASGSSRPATPPASVATRDQGDAPERPGDPAAGAPEAARTGERTDPAANASASAASPAAPGRRAPPETQASAPPLAPAAANLPALAPVRVVLNVAATGQTGRAADIRQALAAAGLEVAELAPAEARRLAPRIGYYFQSDRDAAAGVSRVLAPLLGAVDPVALRMHGGLPEPGTIEVAIP